MNFLNDQPDVGSEPKKDGASKPSPQDLSFHVPTPPPQPPKPPAPPLAPPKPAVPEPVKKPEVLLTPKLASAKLHEPVLPNAAPASAPASGAKQNGARQAAVSNGRDTLHVSLISAGGGIGLSELTVRDRMRRLLFCAVIAIILDGCMFGGILWYSSVVQKQVAGAEENVRSLDADIAKAEIDVKPAKDLQTLLKSADEALKNHTHWTRVLAMIEELAKPQVIFSGATMGSEGGFSTSISAPDYLTIAQQILVLRHDPRIKNVPFSGASKSGGGVSTALNITFDTAVLMNDATATRPQ